MKTQGRSKFLASFSVLQLQLCLCNIEIECFNEAQAKLPAASCIVASTLGLLSSLYEADCDDDDDD